MYTFTTERKRVFSFSFRTFSASVGQNDFWLRNRLSYDNDTKPSSFYIIQKQNKQINDTKQIMSVKIDICIYSIYILDKIESNDTNYRSTIETKINLFLF